MFLLRTRERLKDFYLIFIVTSFPTRLVWLNYLQLGSSNVKISLV